MNNSNNTEVEAKILDVSHTDLEEKIHDLWWKKIFDWILDAVWMVNVNWERVRVRKEWDKTMTEYKKLIWGNDNFKENIEIPYSPDSHENQIKVFEALWLKQANRSIKRRVSYLLENNDDFWKVQLDFDKYSDLDWMEIPELLEIEASSWEVILKVAEILWFKEEDLKNWWARELAENYAKILKN